MKALFLRYFIYQVGFLMLLYGVCDYFLNKLECPTKGSSIHQLLLLSAALVLALYLVFFRLVKKWPDYPGFVFMGTGMVLMISLGLVSAFGFSASEECLLVSGLGTVAFGISALVLQGLIAYNLLNIK
jgi:hypothetical protein